MLTKVFLQSAGNFEEKEILMRFYEGIKKIEMNSHRNMFDEYTRTGVFLDSNYHYTDCDVAIMMGSWKNRERDHHATRNSIVENSKCFLVIETPLLNRKVFQPSEQHRVGMNGFLNNQGKFHQGSLNTDRFNKLNITWPGWQNNPTGHILLLLQLPGDASLRGTSTYDWALNSALRLRKHTDKKIVVRTHPHHKPKESDEWYKFYTELSMNVPNVSFSMGKDKSIIDDLKNAYCTVSFTSGSSIDSIVAGIPTLATDPGNFAFDISSRCISEINNLRLAAEHEIRQWLYGLSYSQWSVDEMENGDVWRHFFPILHKHIENLPAEPKKKK